MEIIRKFTENNKEYAELESPLFDGENINVRIIKDKDENEFLIGNSDLEAIVRTGIWGDDTDGFNPKDTDEAIEIYDDIFFWVSSSEYELPDKELKELLNEALEEEGFVP